jgi:hypothetical protein
VPALAPRIILKLTNQTVAAPDRLAGHGTIDQVMTDLGQLHVFGADTVVLDPFEGDPEETCHPEKAWRALAAVIESWKMEQK